MERLLVPGIDAWHAGDGEEYRERMAEVTRSHVGRVSVAVVARLSGALGAVMLYGLTHAVSKTHGLVGVRTGAWVDLVGALTMLISALIERPAQATNSLPVPPFPTCSHAGR